MDFGVIRNVRFAGRHRLQVRTEVFKLFTRVNPGMPVNNVSASNYG